MSTIDLTDFELTFHDEFDSLSISSDPDSDATWYTRTPWNGDFGAASFKGSETNGTFSISEGVLSITAQKDENGNWTSGLLSSVDPNGDGFSQQYGYFEIRAELPAGAGVWPAFWLVGMNRLEPGSTYTAELDIFEHYGAMPGTFSSKWHVWQRDGSGGHDWAYQRTAVEPGALSSGFHTYGVLVEEDYTTFYFDGVEQWKIETPEEHQQPMMVLADFALGGGWPVTDAPDGTSLKIDYIRVYAEVPGSEPEAPRARFSSLFDIEAREANTGGVALYSKGGTLVGTCENDQIFGTDGFDRLQGHKGDDVIHGGGYKDQLFGDQGNDTLFGDAGNDELYGGGGNDMLMGGEGDDFLNGGGGIDLLCGGEGADRYIIRARDKGQMLTHEDAPGESFAQWVEVYGLDFAQRDKLTFEGFVGLESAIGRDNIVSDQTEFDALCDLLRNDGNDQTDAAYDAASDSMVLHLTDTSGALHVVGIHQFDLVA